MVKTPLVSVITVCRNSISTIQRAIDSVASQTYQNIEHIVVDGASTDGTVDFLKSLNNPRLKWQSEPDKGISDAFNKGIARSSGEFHIILNADDMQYSECIETLVSEIKSDCVAVCGNSDLLTIDGEKLRRFRSVPAKLPWKMSIAHNCVLLRTSTFFENGGYSLSRKIAMDHELFVKIHKRHGTASFRVVDKSLCAYYLGGVSDKLALKGFAEVRTNIYETYDSPFHAWTAWGLLYAKHNIRKMVS